MSKYNKYKNRNNRITASIIEQAKEIRNSEDKMSIDSGRIIDIIQHANIIISDIDTQFESATKLNKVDVKFLLFATALQCVRQYIIGTITQRVGDQEAANKTAGHEREHSQRHHKLYNPNLDEIMTNPVPFDAIYGGKDFNLGIGGGFTHRAKTLGHDPLLGWIFGTTNIATSTVTVAENFKTYHVLTGETARGDARDKIAKHASTIKALEATKNKLLFEGLEGKKKVGMSVIKEAIHLKSDLYSTASIPIPVISTFSVDLARNLADYGIDMGNTIKVSKQAIYTTLINSLIGMIHGLFFDKSLHTSWKLYSVKTKKIISYSNLIASSSNVIAVTIAALTGVAPQSKVLNYLDFGGIVVTIYRLINDRNFILEVEKEFLEREWYNTIMNTK